MSAVIQFEFKPQPRRLPLHGGADIVPFVPKRPIICVSRSDNGREYWTGFLKDCDDELILCLHNCYSRVTEGECEYCDDEGDPCDPDYIASIYLGTEKDLDDAMNGPGHNSHALAKRCKELDLGDYL